LAILLAALFIPIVAFSWLARAVIVVPRDINEHEIVGFTKRLVAPRITSAMSHPELISVIHVPNGVDEIASSLGNGRGSAVENEIFICHEERSSRLLKNFGGSGFETNAKLWPACA
jgi:hypothetical protein